MKTPAKTTADNTAVLERKIRAEIEQEPLRGVERYEHFKSLLRSGASENIFRVISQASTDKRADWAVREFIAEAIDQGRENVLLNAQLRAYAIMYLVHPIEIMRRRDGQ